MIKFFQSIFILLAFNLFAIEDEGIIHRIFHEELSQKVVEISPILMGLTNHNYKVQTNNRTYFIRLGNQLAEVLGIDREKELHFLMKISGLDICPQLIYSDVNRGILVFPFLDNIRPYGKINGVWSDDQEKVINNIIAFLKKYHSIVCFDPDQKPYHFDILEKYLTECKKASAILPCSTEYLFKIINKAKILLEKQKKYPLVLCHNDLYWANFLDDKKKTWLIDWEYADWGDPFFDLASICIEHQLDESQRLLVLKAYCPSFGEMEIQRLEIMCMLYSCRSALWTCLKCRLFPDPSVDSQIAADIYFSDFWKFAEKLGFCKHLTN